MKLYLMKCDEFFEDARSEVLIDLDQIQDISILTESGNFKGKMIKVFKVYLHLRSDRAWNFLFECEQNAKKSVLNIINSIKNKGDFYPSQAEIDSMKPNDMDAVKSNLSNEPSFQRFLREMMCESEDENKEVAH